MSNATVDSDDRDEPALAPGTCFGQYVISRRIGKGGMGSVYEAAHRELGKRVALKTLHPSAASRAQVRARFLREGIATSRLRHPHVVDVSDFGEHEGTAFLVMEHLEGESLAQHLAREGPLTIERLVAVMLPVCAAVAAAHAEGIVHRDLKPANLFLARARLGGEVVKVLDFGVSKFLDVDTPSDLTASAAMLGTLWYMSPEHVQGAREVTPASDQYALGVILYECATGRRPIMGESLYPVMRDITEGHFLPPRTLRPALPEALEAVILRAMARAPDERFASVVALASALLPFASAAVRTQWEPVFRGDHVSVPAPVPSPAPDPLGSTADATLADHRVSAPVSTPPPPRPPVVDDPPSLSRVLPRRPRWAVALVVAALLAAAGLGALGLRPAERARPAPPPVARPQSTAPAPPPVAPPQTLAAMPAPQPQSTAPAPAPAPRPRAAAPRPGPRRPAGAPTPRTLGANGAPIEE